MSMQTEACAYGLKHACSGSMFTCFFCLSEGNLNPFVQLCQFLIMFEVTHYRSEQGSPWWARGSAHRQIPGSIHLWEYGIILSPTARGRSSVRRLRCQQEGVCAEGVSEPAVASVSRQTGTGPALTPAAGTQHCTELGAKRFVLLQPLCFIITCQRRWSRPICTNAAAFISVRASLG